MGSEQINGRPGLKYIHVGGGPTTKGFHAMLTEEWAGPLDTVVYLRGARSRSGLFREAIGLYPKHNGTEALRVHVVLTLWNSLAATKGSVCDELRRLLDRIDPPGIELNGVEAEDGPRG